MPPNHLAGWLAYVHGAQQQPPTNKLHQNLSPKPVSISRKPVPCTHPKPAAGQQMWRAAELGQGPRLHCPTCTGHQVRLTCSRLCSHSAQPSCRAASSADPLIAPGWLLLPLLLLLSSRILRSCTKLYAASLNWPAHHAIKQAQVGHTHHAPPTGEWPLCAVTAGAHSSIREQRRRRRMLSSCTNDRQLGCSNKRLLVAAGLTTNSGLPQAVEGYGTRFSITRHHSCRTTHCCQLLLCVCCVGMCRLLCVPMERCGMCSPTCAVLPLSPLSMKVLNSLSVASKSAAACAAFSSACSAATWWWTSLQEQAASQAAQVGTRHKSSPHKQPKYTQGQGAVDMPIQRLLLCCCWLPLPGACK